MSLCRRKLKFDEASLQICQKLMRENRAKTIRIENPIKKKFCPLFENKHSMARFVT